MGAKATFTMTFAVLAATGFAAVWLAVRITSPDGSSLPAFLGGAITALIVLGLGAGFGRLVVAPQQRLVRGLRSVRENRSSEAGLSSGPAPLLGELPGECGSLVATLQATRREVRKAVQAEAADLDAQKVWLESILQGLHEGVFVCNRQNRIMLYNHAAVSLLDAPDRIGLGRDLGELLTSAPLRHSLKRLEQRHEADPDAPLELSAPFVCTSAGGDAMFNGRMALLTDQGGAPNGYIVTLVDISGELELLTKGDGVRRALTRDLRGMVGNLRAAAETMADHKNMPAEDRARFEGVVLEEAQHISIKIDELGREIRGHMLGRWPMADIYALDLVRYVQGPLSELGVTVTMVGMPLWLHGDSLSLGQALECIAQNVSEEAGISDLDIEPMLGDKRVYLDLTWQGPLVPEASIENWLDHVCGEDAGAQKLRDVLERHGSEPWSQVVPGREGWSMLRLPLLAPHRPQFNSQRKRLPARPEFYDFGLMKEHQADSELSVMPLRDVPFVVFDCEMTGLQPTQGDEIIQIGAVRVLQGRVLTGEGAEWLVNPGRPIPPGSIKFHGLTDADVAGKPGIAEVLPKFHDYVGDGVMVAHNAAFDMKFISLKQHSTGVRFANPVLDTMLVSALLDGSEDDHSLDALCDRYGISISGRHTALGDTIGTAELLLRMIDRLEAKGFTTFGDAMKATGMAAKLRHREAVVSHGTGAGG